MSAYYFENTEYWSDGDERAHFHWLSQIPVVSSVRGAGNRLFLTIDEPAVTDDDIRELIAIYRRYGGDELQLVGLEQQRHVNSQGRVQ